MKKHSLTALIILTFFLVHSWIGIVQASSGEPAQKIMAGCLYHLIRLTQWPENETNTICVCFISSSDTSVSSTFLQESKQKSNTDINLNVKNLPLKQFTSQDDQISKNLVSQINDCQVIYFEEGTESVLEKVQPYLDMKPVLTVAGDHSFPDKNGMVGFYVEDNHIRIKVNLNNIQDASLKISAQFLQHADY